MPSLVKKIASLLALLLVAIPFVFSIFSVVRLAIIKNQVSEKLRSEQLQTVTLSKSDVKWVIQGKEILIGGNLFDVKSCKNLQNNLEITGIYDREEDNLQDHLDRFFHEKEQGNSTNNAVMLNLLFQTWFIEKNTFFQIQIAEILLKKNKYSFTENLVSLNSDIQIPPPKA